MAPPPCSKTGNPYAASALIRQLVEVDYLIWHFVAEPCAGAEWLRASPEERRGWNPKQVRANTAEPFRDTDYWQHCDFGGHPTPEGGARLLDAEDYVIACTWLDLAVHSLHAWDGLVAVAAAHGHPDLFVKSKSDAAHDLDRKIGSWRSAEQVPQLYREARSHETSTFTTEAPR
jgi:hypothetical protein